MNLTKITPPRITGILCREKLFRKLDGFSRKPMTWVSGTAGSGKTTLVASYLENRSLPCLWYRLDERDADIATFFHYLGLATEKSHPGSGKYLPAFIREYLDSVSVFAKNYFESLFSEFTPPFVLVFDNYQDVDQRSLLNQVFVNGLAVLPHGFHIIIISRGGPETEFARTRAHGEIAFIQEEDLRFSLEETVELAALSDVSNLSADLIQRIYQKTAGWTAGLVLALDNSLDQSSSYPALDTIPDERLFDYFAAEILEKVDNDTQTFLLKSAILPDMTAEMAEQLTGLKDAAEILKNLNRNNFFVEKHVHQSEVYYYHPLFRDFLKAFAQDHLGKTDRLTILDRAAEIMVQSGRFDDAIQLYLDGERWEKAVPLILMTFRSMMEQNRYGLLEKWLIRLPKSIIETNGWISLCLGITRFWDDPEESRHCFERAFEILNGANDNNGVYYAWSGIVESIFFENGDASRFDPWVDWMNGRTSDGIDFPSDEIEMRVVRSMLGALNMRFPYHKNASLWTERAERLINTCEDPDDKIVLAVKLYQYYLNIGDFNQTSLIYAKLAPIIKSSKIKPLTRLWVEVLNLTNIWLTAQSGKTSLNAVNKALKTAAELGIHLVDRIFIRLGAQTALALRDFKAFDKFMGQLEAYIAGDRSYTTGIYHLYLSARYMEEKDNEKALEHARIGLEMAERFGLPIHTFWSRILISYVLMGMKRFEEVESHISKIRQFENAASGFKYKGIVRLLESFYALDTGQDRKSGKLLKQAFKELKTTDNANIVFWIPSALLKGCAKALDEGIEVKYVQSLVKRANLLPEPGSESINNWPFPIKIRTMGRFEIENDGEVIRFGKKIPKKPLALLKIIIALGGQDVTEEQISDALWSEADGDSAHSAFSTTLQRLRKVIGDDRAIRLHEGKVSLDKRYCWVDTWALQSLMDNLDYGINAGDKPPEKRDLTESIQLVVNRVNELYQGPFLSGEEGEPLILFFRERLSAQYIKFCLHIGVQLEKTSHWENAVNIYLRGLEADSLVEEFYQRLLICYRHLGLRAEGITLYDQCRQTFSDKLGITPSNKTTEIYRGLLE